MDPAPQGRTVRLDVNGMEPPEPMLRILAAANALEAGDTLLVEHFREPVPLYAHLEAAGFSHATEKLGEARFLLTIRRSA